MPTTGVIAIGRNEGERLRACLASVVGRGMPVVYVDSASTDGSVALAQALGAEVVELDMGVPFSAARARNEGFARLVAVAPGTGYVLFVDGDCEVVPGWVDRAVVELEANPRAAVVCGRRRERFPGASIYNRLADLEWDRPAGEVQSCGGDAVVRAAAFAAVGGYDPTVVAGEEPEMCQRLRAAGWTIHRIDAEMTVHDSAMLRFGQWWKRQIRSGYGAIDVLTRFPAGPEPLFAGQVRSARLWGRIPVGVITLVLTAPVLWWITRSATLLAIPSLAAAACALAWVGQAMRIAARSRRHGATIALANGFLAMIAKTAHLVGQRQYHRDRRAGRLTRLIDYKTVGVPPILHPGPAS